MLRHLATLLLLAAIALPLSAADTGGFKVSRMGATASAGKINPRVSGSVSQGSALEQPGGKLTLPPLTKKPKGVETKAVQLPADLSASIAAYRNTYSSPGHGWTEGRITNLGPGKFTGGRMISVYAVFGSGHRKLIGQQQVGRLAAGSVQPFHIKWPNVDSFTECTFQVVIHGSDANNGNNNASCGWQWASVVP
jgi:hypothetical protein